MPAVWDLPDETRDGDERTTLVAMLEYYRAVMARKAIGLTTEQAHQRVGASTLTIGSLIKHMAMVEHIWFPERFAGRPPEEPWASAPWDLDADWEFHSAADSTIEELLELFEREVTLARTIIDAAPDLDTLAPEPGRHGPYHLRWILVHMIEEYARHCGHADLLREAIDGATGD